MAVDNFARALATKAIAGGGGGGTSDYDILSNKPIINQDLSETGFAPSNNTYYRHTGSTETFANGIIYRFDGTGYEAVGDCPIKSISAGGVALSADENGNVDVPLQENGNPGLLASADSNYGIVSIGEGKLRTSPATNSNIDSRLQQYRVISSSNLDYAVKAAMCDGKGAAWTEAEQKAACARAGAVYDGQFELIEEIACDGEATAYTRTVDVNGNPYNLLSVYIEFEIETGNSYTSAVFFRAYDAEGNAVLYDGILVNQRNYVTYLFGGVDAKNGMYQGWMISGNIASYTSGGSSEKRINRRAPIISPIKKINIMVGDDLKFLSGDKIRIYGVRA